MKSKHWLLNAVKLLFKILLLIIRAIPRALGDLRRWLLKRLRFSITFKITTFYGVIFSLMLLFINLIVCAAMVGFLGYNAAQDLKHSHQLVAPYFKENQQIPTANIEQSTQLNQVEITVFDHRQRVLYTTDDQPSLNPALNITDNYFLELGLNNRLILQDGKLQIARS
ncbi:hypothetical protein V6C27_09865 [Peptococcaceae bacterium 1198_IL3148]